MFTEIILGDEEMELKRIVNGITGITKSTLGFDRATDETILNRKIICNQCKFKQKNKCNICGCYVNIKVKINNEKCPKDFW